MDIQNKRNAVDLTQNIKLISIHIAGENEDKDSSRFVLFFGTQVSKSLSGLESDLNIGSGFCFKGSDTYVSGDFVTIKKDMFSKIYLSDWLGSDKEYYFPADNIDEAQQLQKEIKCWK